MKKVIEIHDLVKKYPNFTLGPINLDIPEGQIIGLIGENGAGKTTLIKAILNIIKTSEGSIKNNAEDIGVVLDDCFFPELLTPKDIDLVMKNIYQNWNPNLFSKYLTDLEVPQKQTIKSMSKGMRKKLEIATALAHQPHLLILDEPTSGLDPVIRSTILDIFLNFMQDEKNTIIFSTHITSDLEHIADTICFLDNGKIILNEDRDSVLDNYGIIKCDSNEFKNIAHEDIIRYKKNRYNYEVLIKDYQHLKKKYRNLVVDKVSLDDLMVLMIKGEKIK